MLTSTNDTLLVLYEYSVSLRMDTSFKMWCDQIEMTIWQLNLITPKHYMNHGRYFSMQTLGIQNSFDQAIMFNKFKIRTHLLFGLSGKQQNTL